MNAILLPKLGGIYPIGPKELPDQVHVAFRSEVDLFLTTLVLYAKSVNSYSFSKYKFHEFCKQQPCAYMLTQIDCEGYLKKMTKSEKSFVVDFGGCFHLTHSLISQSVKQMAIPLSFIQWNDEPNMWREVRRVEIEAIISEAKETDNLGPFLAEKYPLTQQMKSYVEVIGGQLVMKQAYLNQLFIDYPHSDCVVSASHEELPKRSLLQLVSKR